MIWFKGLHNNSINSWGELCSEFTSHFTARRKRLKTMVALNAVVQDKKETSREYIKSFTRAGVEVQSAHDGSICFIFESDLRDDCKFKEELGFRMAKDMNNLLTRTQPYINYDEKKLAEEALINKQTNKVDNNRRRNDNEKTRGSCPHPKDYTPLNASQ